MATHVLLVDDSCVDRMVASRVFESCNVKVEGAKQALKFLDMKSPKLNHLPVVITCTNVFTERVKRCLDGGAKDFIAKPIKVDDVPHILSYI
uniref:Response regulatory domain-containing protein n=1 Tax=Setaria italica TaxID=4555 RepID=K3YN96_SETIT